MKRNRDFENDKETFQNFLHINNISLQDEVTTTIENQNLPIFKKSEEKRGCDLYTTSLLFSSDFIKSSMQSLARR